MGAEAAVNHAPFTPDELAAITGGRWAGPGASVSGVSTDSRQIEPGQLFVALSGEHFDGHAYVATAAGSGAAAALVLDAQEAEIPQLVVADTLASLQTLAAFHRRRFDVPVVGLTGSNGKTTTKEMIAAALTPLGPIHKTTGNHNNHIGVPLTLLGIDAGHRAVVVEMGMNHPGEIRRLAALARPSIAVITNAGRAHLESMGSREAVVEAKSEIAEGLSASDMLIFFGDDQLLREKSQARPCRRLTFGFGSTVDLTASAIVEKGLFGTEFTAAEFGRVGLRIPGRHNVLNALAALAVARSLAVPPAEAAAALGRLGPAPGRMSVKAVDGLTVIDDSYNANPDSMRAALDLLKETPHAGRRVAVLGEMLELGSATVALHREVGAAASFVDRLFAIGPSAAELSAAALSAGLAPERVVVARDRGGLIHALLTDLKDGDLILVKGSRGMALEKVVEAIEAEKTGASGKGH